MDRGRMKRNDVLHSESSLRCTCPTSLQGNVPTVSTSKSRTKGKWGQRRTEVDGQDRIGLNDVDRPRLLGQQSLVDQPLRLLKEDFLELPDRLDGRELGGARHLSRSRARWRKEGRQCTKTISELKGRGRRTMANVKEEWIPPSSAGLSSLAKNLGCMLHANWRLRFQKSARSESRIDRGTSTAPVVGSVDTCGKADEGG